MNTNLVERLMGTIYESNPKDQLSRVAVLTLFVATVSIFLFIWSFKKSRKGRVQLPPGPRGLPIIGYVPFLDSDLHRSFAELAKIYGPIMKLQIGSKLSVVLSSASLAKEVLRDQDITFANRDPPIAASTIANGGADIAWSPYGPTWRMLRKYYHEMLHSSSLVCSARRRDVVEKAVREVYNKNGTPINIAELSFLTIFEVVISMLWGDTGEESGIKGEFYEMAEKLVELMDKSNISDLYPILAPFDIQGVEGEMKKLMQRFDHIFDPIIDQRLKLKGERIPNKKGNKDFLQFLLEREEQEDNENPMTRTEIKALIMETAMAGTHTTSNTLEWAMTELVHHPEVIRRVQEELDEVLGVDNIVEESHLPKLQYLDAVVKETLRLYPAAPLLVPHCPSLSCVVGGYTIPKGAKVVVNVWAIQRNPEVWNNPLEFQPERFLKDKGKYGYNGNNFNYLPFGSGRRMCAGLSLAESLLMYTLASLLRSFHWQLPKGMEIDLSDKFGIVLKKKVPLVAIATPRLSNLELYA